MGGSQLPAGFKSCEEGYYMAAEKTAAAGEYTNDYAVTRVPQDKRRSIYSIATVTIGFCISMAGLYTGASMTAGINLGQAVGAALLGNLILVIYSGLIGVIGAREGMATSVILRRAFGKYGADLFSLITMLTLVGWYAYQCGFFGSTINTMFPNAGFITKPVVAGIWGGALMMLTAYKGYRGLEILSVVAAPAIFIIAIIGIIISVNGLGGWTVLSELSTKGTGDVTFGSAVVMVVGAFAVGGVIQPDITRYAKNATHCMVGTAIGYLIAHSFVILAGYIMCVTAGTSEVAQALLTVLGLPALIILILAQWTTNDNNLYSSTLAFNQIVPRVHKKTLVIIFGVIATIIGAFGLGNYFTSWLVILGTFVPPVAGIAVADYFCFKKHHYPFGESEGVDVKIGGLSIPAILSWAGGAVVGFTVSWGVACINALVVSFILYVILYSIFKGSASKGFVGGSFKEKDDGELIRE